MAPDFGDESGYYRVNEVYAGSPAEQAGLLQNDLIVAVEGQDAKTAGYTKRPSFSWRAGDIGGRDHPAGQWTAMLRFCARALKFRL